MPSFRIASGKNYSIELRCATPAAWLIKLGSTSLVRTQIFLLPGQTNPLYRTYVEHTSPWLEPNEVQKVKATHAYDPSNLLKVPVPLGDDTIFEADPDYIIGRKTGPGASPTTGR
jgi:hypothetical protein